jgi:hypothetical protein
VYKVCFSQTILYGESGRYRCTMQQAPRPSTADEQRSVVHNTMHLNAPPHSHSHPHYCSPLVPPCST